MRQGHDAGVVPENVEVVVVVAEEGVGAAFDGGENVQVEVQEEERAVGAGDTGFDFGDGFRGFLLRPRCYVDFGMVEIEDLGEGAADAARGACYDEDLVLISTACEMQRGDWPA